MMIHLWSKLEDRSDLALFVLLEDESMYMELKPKHVFHWGISIFGKIYSYSWILYRGLYTAKLAKLENLNYFQILVMIIFVQRVIESSKESIV
jgi:hypothetical protein